MASGSKPGERRGGRKKGTPNKFTGVLKDMILKALDQADEKGAVAYLTKQATANPSAFMTLLGKVLPLQVAGEGGGPLVVYRVDYADAAALPENATVLSTGVPRSALHGPPMIEHEPPRPAFAESTSPLVTVGETVPPAVPAVSFHAPEPAPEPPKEQPKVYTVPPGSDRALSPFRGWG